MCVSVYGRKVGKVQKRLERSECFCVISGSMRYLAVRVNLLEYVTWIFISTADTHATCSPFSLVECRYSPDNNWKTKKKFEYWSEGHGLIFGFSGGRYTSSRVLIIERIWVINFED